MHITRCCFLLYWLKWSNNKSVVIKIYALCILKITFDNSFKNKFIISALRWMKLRDWQVLWVCDVSIEPNGTPESPNIEPGFLVQPNLGSYPARAGIKIQQKKQLLRDAVGKDKLGRIHWTHHRHECSCSTNTHMLRRGYSIIVMMKPVHRVEHEWKSVVIFIPADCQNV